MEPATSSTTQQILLVVRSHWTVLFLASMESTILLTTAIYVADASPLSYCAPLAPYVPKEECFFQLPGQNVPNGIDVQLVFKYNSADVAGSMLYGGAIDNCKLTGLDSYNSGEVFDMIVHNNDTDYNKTSNISSDPLRICPCENNHPYCGTINNIDVYPGEIFKVLVLAVGQRNGIVPTVVRSAIDQNVHPGDLLDSQYLQQAYNTCTELSYSVSLLSPYVNMVLQAEGTPCSTSDLRILVVLNQICPHGFNISESARSCVCEPRLAQYTNQCNITNGVGRITRERSQQFWGWVR